MPLAKRLIIFLCIMFSACQDKFPQKEYVGDNNYELINQDETKINFPIIFKGKILVTVFMFTSCPDICPMTVHNLQLLQEKVQEEKIQNVEFVTISFDPNRDTPSKLKDFGELQDINFKNFNMCTGDIQSIKKLMKEFSIVAIPGDTTYTASNKPSYFFTHTDRITLIDRELNIRKYYNGSKADIKEIVNDIKRL